MNTQTDLLYNDFQEVLKSLENLEESAEHLSFIFDFHIKSPDEDDLFRNLQEHVSRLLNESTPYLFNYFLAPEVFFDRELEKENKTIRIINDLKIKYGFVIERLFERSKNPFLLNEAEFNIEAGSSTHKIKFSRTDGQSLESTFTSSSMIPLLGLLSNATSQSIEKGIYNLNIEQINYYMRESDKLTGILQNLLKNVEV
ncbi:hypothetical protein [Peribacillus frigoritolerans]|uniref:hypothetical protein n=1 Tax=Peribacillus frigoritolerans TaxID=450367 RepID=UPI003D27689D